MKTPRVQCLSCGTKTWHQPTVAEGQRQVTKEFDRCLDGWLSRLTIQDAALTFGVSWNTACERCAAINEVGEAAVGGIKTPGD